MAHSKTVSIDEEMFEFITIYAEEHRCTKKDVMSMIFEEVIRDKRNNPTSFYNWHKDYRDGYTEKERLDREIERMLDYPNKIG